MDLLSRKIKSTPSEFGAYLRDKGPVFWSEPEKFWVVTDYDLAAGVLRSQDYSADRQAFFMSRMSNCPFSKVANFFGVVKKMMVTSDPPVHTARRRLAQTGIADHVLDEFVPTVNRVVAELLRKTQRGSMIDFCEEIALPLPNIVLADLFSIPAEQRPNFYLWANHMTQFFGGASDNIRADAANADEGAAQLREYFAHLIRERRRNPNNDFISHMLSKQSSLYLEDSEVISQAAIMLVAGTVTTTDQICNNLNAFLEYGMLNAITSQPLLIEAAIEEATRLDPSVNFVFRVAKKDQSLGGMLVQAGQLVFISTHAVNRDPALFPAPETFDIRRTRNPHMSFGSGIHYCLGARLGRIQMKALFSQFLEKHPRVSLAPERLPRRKHQSLAFSGFETFPLFLEER